MRFRVGRKRKNIDIKRPLPRALAIAFGGLFVVAAVLGVRSGWLEAFSQQAKNATYVPAPGEVVSAMLNRKNVTISKNGKKQTGFEPDVLYRFTVGEKTYESRRFAAAEDRGDEAWAKELMLPYPPGRFITVYHDPAKPAEAFLVRRWSFYPYMGILMSMIHFTIGLAVVLGVGLKVPGRRVLGSLTLAWWAAGAPGVAHYFATADRPFPTGPIVACSLYLGFGAVLALIWFRLITRTANRGPATDEVWPRPIHGEKPGA
jgi:hypothetical protein